MKVLFFNYEYPPLGGGAGVASSYILDQYAKIPGLEVDFVTSSVDNQFHVSKISENITLHRIPIGKNEQNIHYQTKKELVAYYLGAYKYAKKLIRKNSYDLTHSFFTVPCGYVSYKIKKRFGLPYIISLRGSDVPGYSERFTMLYSFITPIIKRIWEKANFVIANSKGLKELALNSKPKKEIGIIYNGINVHEFYPDESQKNSDEFCIICTSRITPRKGIRLLVQAVDLLSKRYDNLRLLLVGDGNEKASLQNLVRAMGLSDKVEFCGVVPHEKIAVYYQKANVFVLPSFNEGMSNTMLEALASGLPIIATDVGGTRELVDEGENGLIIKTGDYYDIEEKLERLILDKQLEKNMGVKSREKALLMSWEKVANDYHALYREVANLRKLKGE